METGASTLQYASESEIVDKLSRRSDQFMDRQKKKFLQFFIYGFSRFITKLKTFTYFLLISLIYLPQKAHKKFFLGLVFIARSGARREGIGNDRSLVAMCLISMYAVATTKYSRAHWHSRPRTATWCRDLYLHGNLQQLLIYADIF